MNFFQLHLSIGIVLYEIQYCSTVNNSNDLGYGLWSLERMKINFKANKVTLNICDVYGEEYIVN